jgi:hypothetical protein
MLREPDVKKHQISIEEYMNMYKDGRLGGRKVKASLVGEREDKIDVIMAPPVITTVLDI